MRFTCWRCAGFLQFIIKHHLLLLLPPRPAYRTPFLPITSKDGDTPFIHLQDCPVSKFSKSVFKSVSNALHFYNNRRTLTKNNTDLILYAQLHKWKAMAACENYFQFHSSWTCKHAAVVPFLNVFEIQKVKICGLCHVCLASDVFVVGKSRKFPVGGLTVQDILSLFLTGGFQSNRMEKN